MARRDRYYWGRLLIGAAFGILVVDVLVLAVLVVNLRAAPQVSPGTRDLPERPVQTVADQVLMLPTHDPAKPWPTRTPLPTATPWLEAAVRLAAQRQAELASVRNAAQPAASLAGDIPTPEPIDTSIPSMLSTTVAAESTSTVGFIATLQVGAMPAGMPGPTLEASSSVESSGTITRTAAAPAEIPDAANSVPSPTLSPETPEPTPSEFTGDEAQFIAYVEGHYNTIADQPLDITAVTFVHLETGIPSVTVEVSEGTTNNVFAVQTADVVADYGRRLLNDVKSFFNGQSCIVNIMSTYETSDADGCTRSPNWCDLRDYSQASQAWSVVWTYAVGTSIEGSDSLQTWNAGQ
jgi:hypothetical protein